MIDTWSSEYGYGSIDPSNPHEAQWGNQWGSGAYSEPHAPAIDWTVTTGPENVTYIGGGIGPLSPALPLPVPTPMPVISPDPSLAEQIANKIKTIFSWDPFNLRNNPVTPAISGALPISTIILIMALSGKMNKNTLMILLLGGFLK